MRNRAGSLGEPQVSPPLSAFHDMIWPPSPKRNAADRVLPSGLNAGSDCSETGPDSFRMGLAVAVSQITISAGLSPLIQAAAVARSFPSGLNARRLCWANGIGSTFRTLWSTKFQIMIDGSPLPEVAANRPSPENANESVGPMWP